MRWPWSRTSHPGHLNVTWPPPDVDRAGTSQAVLTGAEVDVLGRYHAEKARGLQHTPEWQDRMAELQRRFNVEQNQRNVAYDQECGR